MIRPIYKTRLTLAVATPEWRGVALFRHYADAFDAMRADAVDLVDILGREEVAAGGLRVEIGQRRIVLGNGATIQYLGGPHMAEKMRGAEFDFIDGLNLLPTDDRLFWLEKLSQR